MYFTGDGCRRDADGYYWITGRVDDVINVTGHRIGTAEVESALVAHPKVAEAAVVGVAARHQGPGHLRLRDAEGRRRRRRGAAQGAGRARAQGDRPDRHARLAAVGAGLPKTRSGKIMRRILRKIAENAPDQLGDISTLADPDGGGVAGARTPGALTADAMTTILIADDERVIGARERELIPQ